MKYENGNLFVNDYSKLYVSSIFVQNILIIYIREEWNYFLTSINILNINLY